MSKDQRAFLPRFFGTFMPWYNPARVALPKDFYLARETFTAMAAGVQ